MPAGEHYAKHIEYHFAAHGELFAIEVRSEECLKIRSLSSKSPCGFVNKVGKSWKWDTFENSESVFARHRSQAQADAIVEYINAHPVPGTE